MSNGLQDTEMEAIDMVAKLLTRGHTDSGKHMIYGALLEACIHPPSAGVVARFAWHKAVIALGETCLTLAKREKDKFGK